MSEIDQLLRERLQYREQNEQLKIKYKKVLQQLMHILNVNKSLKQYLDQSNANRDQIIREQIENQKNRHQREMETYLVQLNQLRKDKVVENQRYKQLQEHNRLLQKQEAERKRMEEVKKMENIQKKAQQMLQNSLKSSQQGQLQRLRAQNQHLKKRLLPNLQFIKERQFMSGQIQELKQQLKQVNLQLLDEKQRWRSQIFSKETEYLRTKESEGQRLRTIQSRNQLLQNQLTNYKNIEKYIQEDAKSVIDEENVFNSIREQIDKINQDFSKYQMESSNILLKKREEDAQRNRRIIQLETQLARVKNDETRLNIKLQELEQLKTEVVELRKRYKQLQNSHNGLLQKNHVLQALLVTQKHRDNTGIAERVKQFEMRMKLLLKQKIQDQAIYGGIQQVIILKSYIKQLSELVNHCKKKQQQLLKKNQSYKLQILQVEKVYKEKIDQYKKKILDYDTLVSKLYKLVEEKVRDRNVDQNQKEFYSAITHYEEKMLSMSDQILKLRRRKEQLEILMRNREIVDGKGQINSVEQENSTYKGIISDLSIKMNELQVENSQLTMKIQEFSHFQEQIRDKNKIIDDLAKQLEQLTMQMKDYQQKQSNMKQIINNYCTQLEELKAQLQTRDKTNYNSDSKDTAALIQKVNYLQLELTKNKNTSNEAITSSQSQETIKNLQSKVSQLLDQINEHKQEIDKLHYQLKIQKTEKQSNVADQYSIISQLQRNITDLQKLKGVAQVKILNIENDYKRADQMQKEQIDTLRYQNRALSQQLSSKHAEMMVYYEQLNSKTHHQQEQTTKIQQMEQIIGQLQYKIQQVIERSTIQINELTNQIIGLRTTNIASRNQIQAKEDIINQLKHQLFNLELRNQKDTSGSISFMRQSRENQQNASSNQQTTLMLLVMTFAEVESLRRKNQQLQQMYHEDLIKYQQALKILQSKQMELCHSLQLSSSNQIATEQKQFSRILHQSQGQISQQSEQSRTIIRQSYPIQKTLQSTIRSYEVYPATTQSQTPSIKLSSNVSIGQQSPLKRRAMVIKKI